jgi:hypothetical protein
MAQGVNRLMQLSQHAALCLCDGLQLGVALGQDHFLFALLQLHQLL